MPYPMAAARGGMLRYPASSGPIFLLRDDFITDASAPLASPRTAGPGPGTLALVQTDGQFSVSGGKLAFPAQSSPNWGDLAFAADVQTRQSGRAILSTIRFTNLGTYWWLGYNNDNTPADSNISGIVALRMDSGGGATYVLNGTHLNSGLSLAINTDYTLAVSMRSTGAFYFIKGGAFSSWTLLWVDVSGSASGYPSFSTYNAAGTLDFIRVLDLPAPFDTDYGLATQRTASPVANDTITSEANADIEFTWTAVTSETLELSVRRTTDNDRWIIRGSQAGSTVKLIEVVAGVETERGSAAQTWTNTTAYRVVVIQDGTTIRVYVANVLMITYSSASSNSSATGVKTNKAGSNLIAYPRVLTGAAAALLDASVA